MSITPISQSVGPEVVDSKGNLKKPVPDSADARPSGREATKVFRAESLQVDASPALDPKLFDNAVEEIEKFLKNNAKNELAVHVDDTLNRPILRIIDPKQGEILRIPGQHVLTVAKNIESLRGVLFDERA